MVEKALRTRIKVAQFICARRRRKNFLKKSINQTSTWTARGEKNEKKKKGKKSLARVP